MKRLTAILFAAAALAVPFTACAQQGAIERIESKVDQVLQLLQKGVPTVVVPPTIADPVPVTPVTPTGGPSCNVGGPYLINGRGDVHNVCACPSAIVRLRNVNPMTGATISWAKTPGTGDQAVPLGPVVVSEGGRLIGASGGVASGRFDIGIGDRDLVFTAERCTNLVVSVP